MKTWLNYTKAKGTANINGINQHRILYMELRVKFKQKENSELHKHVNYDINNLRENTTRLTLQENDPEVKTATEKINKIIHT